MVYEVYELNRFEKDFNKLDRGDQKIVRNIITQLIENPYVGDILRYVFFREKRLREKRIYYLVYEDLKIVLMIAIGNKKIQQETIDYIIKYFNEYRLYAEKLSKRTRQLF